MNTTGPIPDLATVVEADQFTSMDFDVAASVSASQCGRNGVGRAGVRLSGSTWPARIFITLAVPLPISFAAFLDVEKCRLTVRSSRLMSPATAGITSAASTPAANLRNSISKVWQTRGDRAERSFLSLTSI